MMCHCGAGGPSFEAASRDLAIYAGVNVEAREIQRMVQRVAPALQQALEQEAEPAPDPDLPVLYTCADGTGVPMMKAELKGRKGKQADGSAKTREVKVGCVFTQHVCDEKGMPLRDHDSTTYIGTFERLHRVWQLATARSHPPLHGQRQSDGLYRRRRKMGMGIGSN